jgi:hypothetical protein
MEYAHPEVLVGTKWVDDHINELMSVLQRLIMIQQLTML